VCVAHAQRACILKPGLSQVEDATGPQALPKKEAEFLREQVGVPAGDPAAQRHTQPNTCSEGAVKVFLLLFRLISPGCAEVVRCGV
jgi:hypothetical protein